MLNKIIIENLVCIDLLELNFDKGLNIITGESGSGKSLLVEAIKLVRGGKIKRSLLNKNKSITIIAFFSLSVKKGYHNDNISEVLNSAKPNEIVIKRNILPNGRSTFYLNDNQCSGKKVKDITTEFIQVVSQNSSIELINPIKQRILFDQFIPQSLANMAKIDNLFKNLQRSKKDLSDLVNQREVFNKEKDHWQLLCQEISLLNLQGNDEQILYDKKKSIVNLASKKNALQEALTLLEDEANQYNLMKILKVFSKLINKHFDFDQSMLISLNNIEQEISTISENLQDMLNQASNDDYSELETIENKISKIKTAMRKYQVTKSDDLIDLMLKAETQLKSLSELNFFIKEKEKEVESILVKFKSFATKQMNNHLNYSDDFAFKVRNELNDMSMPYLDFKVEVRILPEDDWHNNGIDAISFMVKSSNDQFDDVKNILSGGELSRLLLAIYNVISSSQKTILFDEIDVGISGAIASNIGHKLYKLANNSQIIVITHQPQVAVYSDNHIKIFKEGETTKGTILSQKEINKEIGVMLSGREVTDSALIAAINMIELAKKDKQ